jgi:hypothetical protein
MIFFELGTQLFKSDKTFGSLVNLTYSLSFKILSAFLNSLYLAFSWL